MCNGRNQFTLTVKLAHPDGVVVEEVPEFKSKNPKGRPMFGFLVKNIEYHQLRVVDEVPEFEIKNPILFNYYAFGCKPIFTLETMSDEPNPSFAVFSGLVYDTQTMTTPDTREKFQTSSLYEWIIRPKSGLGLGDIWSGVVLNSDSDDDE